MDAGAVLGLIVTLHNHVQAARGGGGGARYEEGSYAEPNGLLCRETPQNLNMEELLLFKPKPQTPSL